MSKSEITRLHHQAGVFLAQPEWVCLSCGNKHGRRPLTNSTHLPTWHHGTCGVCGAETEVTQPRDFGYLAKKD